MSPELLFTKKLNPAENLLWKPNRPAALCVGLANGQGWFLPFQNEMGLAIGRALDCQERWKVGGRGGGVDPHRQWWEFLLICKLSLKEEDGIPAPGSQLAFCHPVLVLTDCEAPECSQRKICQSIKFRDVLESFWSPT